MEPNSLLDDLRRQAKPTLVTEPDVEGKPASVVLLSGSFDPLTIAHEAIAAAAAAATTADLVVLVYSVRTVPKEPGAPPPLLDEDARVAWLRRFVEGRGDAALGLSSHGLLPEQVEAAARRFPGARLFAAMGSDKLLQVLDPSWYDDRDAVLDAMFTRTEVRYAMRPGDEGAVTELLADPVNARWAPRIGWLEVSSDLAGVSSRMVRGLIAAGRDAAPFVPEAVRPLLDQRRSRGT
jgi:nicotinic acid mononucleotide adenylyltransferase